MIGLNASTWLRVVMLPLTLLEKTGLSFRATSDECHQTQRRPARSELQEPHPDLRTYREWNLAPRRYPRTSNSKKFSLSLQEVVEASHFILK